MFSLCCLLQSWSGHFILPTVGICNIDTAPTFSEGNLIHTLIHRQNKERNDVQFVNNLPTHRNTLSKTTACMKQAQAVAESMKRSSSISSPGLKKSLS